MSAPITAENDYYVVVADPARNGAYAVGTGTQHPVTLDQGVQSNVLRGGFNEAGISFNSVRSYGSNTDYFFGMPNFLHVADPNFDCVLGSEVDTPRVEMISDRGRDVGIRMSWEIHGGGDDFLVEELLVARGDEFTNAATEITLSVTNLGSSDTRLGLRYAWHLILGNRGGAAFPTIAPRPPDIPSEPYYHDEQSFTPPDFRSYIVSLEDTPSSPGPFDDNEYVVEATVGDIPLDPLPTRPDRFLLTLFGEQLAPPQPARFGAINSCFTYDIADPPRAVHRASGSATVYFWGDTPDTALVVPPGETVSVTQYVFAYLEFPLVCDAGADQVVECAGPTTIVELDGSGSENREGEDIEYLWSTQDAAVVIENETTEHALVHVTGLGRHEIALLAHRGGFATSCTTTVEVVDTTPPDLADVPPDATVECDAVPPRATPTASDTCDASPRITYEQRQVAGRCPDEYALLRTWIAMDAWSNASSRTQVLMVVDTTPPVIAGVPPDTTVECDAVPPPATPSAMDNCDGTPTLAYEQRRADGRSADDYVLTRTWTATDRCGNASRQRQVIKVVDTTAPAPVALLQPTEPLPPRAPSSACSAPASRRFEVRSAATDNCDPSPAVSVTLLVTNHDVPRKRGPCVERVDAVAVSGGETVEIRLVAPPCPAKPPRRARKALSVTSEGMKVVTGEHVVLSVTARDRTGNTARADYDPSREPSPWCDERLIDGTCCASITEPALQGCKGSPCGRSP